MEKNHSAEELARQLSGGKLTEDAENALASTGTPVARDRSFMEILDLQYREAYVSKVLAYLLDPGNDGGNPAFLKAFLDRCGAPDFRDFSGTEVRTEVKTDRGMSIDVVASKEGVFMLLIENKIWSGEHGADGNQTVSYREYCEREYAGCDRTYVYLKPVGNRSDPSANEGDGKAYAVLTYDDVIAVLREIVSSDGHRHTYVTTAEQFLLYCRKYLGSERTMGKMDEKTRTYLDNMQAFVTVERNLGEYRGAYRNWIKEIKLNVRNLIGAYVNDEACKYGQDVDGSDDYHYARLYDKKLEKTGDEYYFFSEIHFCGDTENGDDTRIEVRSTVKKLAHRDNEAMVRADAAVPDEYKGSRAAELADLASAPRKTYLVYDITPIDLTDIIERGGDTGEMSRKIFEEFKNYRETRADRISECFRRGYES